MTIKPTLVSCIVSVLIISTLTDRLQCDDWPVTIGYYIGIRVYEVWSSKRIKTAITRYRDQSSRYRDQSSRYRDAINEVSRYRDYKIAGSRYRDYKIAGSPYRDVRSRYHPYRLPRFLSYNKIPIMQCVFHEWYGVVSCAALLQYQSMLLHYREFYNISQCCYIIASITIIVNVTTLSRVLQF